jgi:DNA-binding beta-propeller fold protein YncE
VGAVVALAVVGMPRAAWASDASDGDFRMGDPRITESSGLALSRAHPHTVWTANDSGDSARVFAVDTRTGKTSGVHTFDAPVRDVEALAITPQGRMLVADIGDNTASRDLVRIFWFDEPALGATSGTWASWEVVYPDGPHDAESIAVNPRTGRVYVVTKGTDGAVYALPPEPSRQGVNRLVRVASAPTVATDAVFLADGSALAVRTYTRVVLLDPRTWRERASALLPLQPQGETIALAPQGSNLLVGSEGRNSLVQGVPVPRAATPAASRSPSPATTSARPTASPSASSSTAAGARASSTSAPVADRSPLILGIAGAVALVAVALLVTWRVRRSRL